MDDKFMNAWFRRGQITKGKKKCGNCKHSDNDLGFVAIHCKKLYDMDDDSKVRSWNPCYFEPSKWEKRVS